MDNLNFSDNFEYWCLKCVKIQDKVTGQQVPFVLNRPQRKLLALMESQRKAGKPVRVILLKARQFGGSTLVQVYIAWHQLVLFKGKNSVIVGHKRNSSYAVKQMLRNVLVNYPVQYYEDPEKPYKLVNVPETKDIQEITERDSKIIITSSYSPDSVRSLPISFAHLTEVAFWQANRNSDPSEIIRSVLGTIPQLPGTIVVLESTANGANSFFYNEWLRAVEADSVYSPIFIGWSDVEMYSKPLDRHYRQLDLSDYEQGLLNKGFTQEQVYWYHEKLKEFPEHDLMMAEYPTTPDEAFVSSSHFVFSAGEQENILNNVAPPITAIDDLKVWQDPCPNTGELKHNYLGMLTIGTTIGDEKDTIFSLWKINDDNRLELVAQMNSKVPLNLLSQKILPLCQRYNDALLIVAENNLDSKVYERGQARFILDDEMLRYRNLYRNKGQKFLNVDRDLYSLMFYELIINEKNQLFVDRDIMACKSIAEMVIHDNQKFYVSYNEEFNFVINRAEVLYVWRDINIRRLKKITEDEKRDLIGF